VRGYLLDTNILSRFAPGKTPPTHAVRAWFREQGEAGTLYLSAMSIAEIERGIRRLYRRGGIEQAGRLSVWLDTIFSTFDDRILAMDAVVARIAGVLEDAAEEKGRHPGLGDVIIAATAQAHDLTVVTENIRHFKPLDVSVDFPAIFHAE